MLHINQIYHSGISTFSDMFIRRLLVRPRACLSALLYKSITYRFDDTNIGQYYFVLKEVAKYFMKSSISTRFLTNSK